MKVSDILARKPKGAYTVGPADTIATLSGLLRERKIGAAVVSRDGRTIEGVITERDIAHKLCLHAANVASQPVSALMTAVVVTCRERDDVGQVASLMLAHNIRHVPVVDDAELLLGMVSIRDVLNLRVDELQRETAMLRAHSIQDDHPPQDRE